MGAYLSKPKTEKDAEDGSFGKLKYGACSMQGWRISQEDAHNCLPEFDPETLTSLFAVYDGHGGSEVAQYCAEELPNYLVKMPTYQDGTDLSDCLVECFLGFDACLLEERTIERLRHLKGDKEDEEEEDDATALKQEADLPLENVLEKYGGVQALPPVLKTLMMVRKKHDFKSPRLSAKSKRCASVGSSGDKVGSTLTEPSEEDQIAAGNSKQEANASGVTQDISENRDDENVKDQEAEKEKPHSNGIDNEEKSKTKEKQVLENGEVDSECLKNGTKDEVRENGLTETDKAVKKQEITDKVDEDEESDDEWNGDAEADEEEDEDEEDSGMEDEDDDDEEEDDDDEDDEDEEDESEDGHAFTFDHQMEDSEAGVDSGTTAVVALLRKRSLYVANAGDSRCVLCRSGKALDLSVDHKPEDEPERNRIMKAGGVVTQDGRVNGGLNLSRAIGDHAYKKNDDLGPKDQMITALPDVRTAELDPETDEFMVMACDGIWNSLTSQEVVDFVKSNMDKNKDATLSDICGELFDFCLADDTNGDGTGCDNMTCILVRFDWSASDPVPVVGKHVKGIKRNEPVESSQPAKKCRVDE